MSDDQKTQKDEQALKDLNKREIAILVPIVVMMFWIGIYSNSFLRKMDATVQQSLSHLGSPAMKYSEIKNQK